MKNKCLGCVRVGYKKEIIRKSRTDLLPIQMKKCHCCIRNPKIKQKLESRIKWDVVRDYYMSKIDLIHCLAKRRGLGAICDDGHGRSQFLVHNSRPSYTKRDKKFLNKGDK